MNKSAFILALAAQGWQFALAGGRHGGLHPLVPWGIRGGEESSPTTEETQPQELSLEEKVQNAMRKLGLQGPPLTTQIVSEASCDDGVCAMPEALEKNAIEEPEVPVVKREIYNEEEPKEDPHSMASRIAHDMGVDKDLAMAALGATSGKDGDDRTLNEEAARAMIQYELDAIAAIKEDCEQVQLLVSEGHDIFLVRRALAFVEMNVEDARAILLADQMDAEEDAKAREMDEEEEARVQLRSEAAADKERLTELKTVTVNSNFDPTLANAGTRAPPIPTAPQGTPSPAKREDVIFDCTAAQIQELVLESPVPVLLDCWASWCGPCMALKPVLEEMAVKAGGIFRLVKINSDEERAVMGALEVTALPTVFGVKDGKILNSFKGMPRGEEMMKNFMMGLLMPGADFNPALSKDEKKKFAELSAKLAKVAGIATFSFSARERLQDRMAVRLDDLVKAHGGNFADAEDSAKVLRSLLSNIIRDPHEEKFRKLNLKNNVIASKVTNFPPAIAILKGIGFSPDGEGSMIVGKGKNVVNVAPLTVARDCIDKWIDRSRHDVATAMRKRKDLAERDRLLHEGAFDKVNEEEEEEIEDVDPNLTLIKVRLEGKKKVHDLVVQADQMLKSILPDLPVSLDESDEFQITCAAKKVVIKSSDKKAMDKSFREHGLYPAATIVIKVGSFPSTIEPSVSLKDRAAAKKTKKGSHTMQTAGIYGKDDGLKGELVDGGGGTVYEQDVTDDEEEGQGNNADKGSGTDDDPSEATTED